MIGIVNIEVSDKSFLNWAFREIPTVIKEHMSICDMQMTCEVAAVLYGLRMFSTSLMDVWPICTLPAVYIATTVQSNGKSDLQLHLEFVEKVHHRWVLSHAHSNPFTGTGADESSEKRLLRSPSDQALQILDRQLRSILEDVRLVYLLDREGGWDASANWEDMLSLGEQQRLGMVITSVDF